MRGSQEIQILIRKCKMCYFAKCVSKYIYITIKVQCDRKLGLAAEYIFNIKIIK
ncbi:hypothetical protein EMIT079MI2_200020 [Bacillus sp. IT-79MI2]